jgi:hypothetical protein
MRADSRFIEVDGRAIRHIRNLMGLTQKQMMIEGGGRPGGHIVDLERGLVQRVTRGTHEAILLGLGVPAEKIAPGSYEARMLQQPLRYSQEVALSEATKSQLREELEGTLLQVARIRRLLVS